MLVISAVRTQDPFGLSPSRLGDNWVLHGYFIGASLGVAWALLTLTLNLLWIIDFVKRC